MTRIALAQINPAVGDLKNNAQLIRDAFANAKKAGAELTVFPKGALSGMPLGGLAADADFLRIGGVLLATLESEFQGRARFTEIFPGSAPIRHIPGMPIGSTADRYYRGGPHAAWERARREAIDANTWQAECRLVGGQDDCIFAGGSFVAAPDGSLLTAGLFKEDLLLFDYDPRSGIASAIMEDGERRFLPLRAARIDDTEELRQALVLAIRDYAAKNGIAGAAVSISGGIDSALVAALAVEALGPDRVKTMTLPGPFTSEETLTDARRLAKNLGIDMIEASIVKTYDIARAALVDVFALGKKDPEDLAGQNLQARIRGMFIMALANKLDLLPLNCSNKSESMVGYGTLYGDMIGGFAPIKDVWKTEVWELSRQVNRKAEKELIPPSIIDRIPSAELRQDQEDRQSIPDYPILDSILKAFVNEGKAYETIVKDGFNPGDLQKAIGLNYASAFKRQQAPLGPVVTPPPRDNAEAMPVVNRFRAWQY